MIDLEFASDLAGLVFPELKRRAEAVEVDASAAEIRDAVIKAAVSAAVNVRDLDVRARRADRQLGIGSQLFDARAHLVRCLAYLGGFHVVGDTLAAEIARAADTTIATRYPGLIAEDFRAPMTDAP